jgi:predicted aldo/keto reductase-like oxidoreductase
MNSKSSRRGFIAAGLSLPAAGLAATRMPEPFAAQAQARPSGGALATRTLGKTGVKVTQVGMGCMITSDPSVVTRAVDMGITYIDTARGYQQGNNERMVGGALGANRNKITLSSKSQATTKVQAMEHLETSLKELGTDHLDIWYMHSRDAADRITDECVDAWTTAKQQGKIRFIGVSTHNPNAIVDRVLQIGKFDVVLSQYSFATGTGNDATYKKLSDAGIGLVAMKVMAPAGGGRGRGGAPPAPVVPGKHLAALKWVLKNPLIGTTIPSMTDIDQLENNFRALSEKISADDEKLLALVNEEIRPYYCRMCHQCSGQCPKGIPVSDTIRYLSYADFYGQFPLGREYFMELPENVRNVRCADCSSCSVRCPNGVHVTERLIRAQELFA